MSVDLIIGVHNKTDDSTIIEATNYWSSEIERIGYLFVSFNKRTFRILVPRALQADLLKEMDIKNIASAAVLRHKSDKGEVFTFVFYYNNYRAPQEPYVIQLDTQLVLPHLAPESHGEHVRVDIYTNVQGAPKVALTCKGVYLDHRFDPDLNESAHLESITDPFSDADTSPGSPSTLSPGANQ